MIYIVITDTDEVNFSFMMVIWLFLSAIKSFFAFLRYTIEGEFLRFGTLPPKACIFFFFLF